MQPALASRHRRKLSVWTKLCALVLSAAFLAVGSAVWASQPKAPGGVVVDSLSVSPAPNGGLTATAKIHAARNIRVQALTVAVRSASGSPFDFPGASADRRLGRWQTTFTTGSRTFPAGTYTYFVAYKFRGAWHHLSPVQSFTSGGTDTPAPDDPPLGIPGTWRQVFADEFDGISLDTTKWNPNWLGCPTCITPPVNDAELAAYAPSQVSVGGGNLHLEAVEQPTTVDGTTYAYRSGLVESHDKAQFTYGAFEARIYTPASGTQIANWPAFWTNGQNTPTDGEMDIMEGLRGSACYHFHSASGSEGGCAPGDFTGWHVYGAEWQPGSVTYYYDGKEVGRIATGITSSPMYLVLNNGVSTEVGGPLVIPADMMADYVRVWQK